MNGRSCSMSRRTTGLPYGPGMISGQQISPVRVHAGAPCPSSHSGALRPAVGNSSASRHLKMPLGGGFAPQSNIDSTIPLPAQSPRRQVVTNGKPFFQVPQPPGLPAPQTLKPKLQDLGNTFSPCTGKDNPSHRKKVNILSGGTILEVGEDPGDQGDAWGQMPGDARGPWLVTSETGNCTGNEQQESDFLVAKFYC